MTKNADTILAFADYLDANADDRKALELQLEDSGGVEQVQRFAQQRGFDFSAEELAVALRASAESSEALSDDQLETVSGGSGDSYEGDEAIFSIVYRKAGGDVGAMLRGARRFWA